MLFKIVMIPLLNTASYIMKLVLKPCIEIKYISHSFLFSYHLPPPSI